MRRNYADDDEDVFAFEFLQLFTKCRYEVEVACGEGAYSDDVDVVFDGFFGAPVRCLGSRPHVLTAFRACGDPLAVLSSSTTASSSHSFTQL